MPARWFLVSLVLFTECLRSQNSEAGIAILNSKDRVLKINADRPLDVAASLLAQDYQIHINAEDPPLACPDDTVDTRPSRKNPIAADHFYLPKGGHLEIRFSVDKDHRPLDSLNLLSRLVAEYNRTSSFRYRLQQDKEDVYSFVPVEARDKNCRLVKITALLDHPISIPKDTRGIYETIRMFDSALSRAAGERTTTNTQTWMNRIPDIRISIGAHDEPARNVLLTIIKATPYRFYWLVREQPYHGGWTINLMPLTGRIIKTPGGYSYPWILWPGTDPQTSQHVAYDITPRWRYLTFIGQTRP